VAAAKAASRYVPGYHFAIPNAGTATAQADYAVSNGRYSEDGQTLPPGLSISGTGQITGATSRGGNYAVTVTGSSGPATSVSFPWSVPGGRGHFWRRWGQN
jgi:hypothetical protein